MKTSDTSSSFATTGVGQRLDLPPDPWFMAEITAVASSGGFFIYDLEEVEPVDGDYGYQTKSGGITVETAQEVNNAEVDVGTIVLARFRAWDDTVATYEFFDPTGAGGGTTTVNVRYGSFYCSVNGVVSPSPGVYGLAVGNGETATGVFTWRAHVFTNSAFGGMALGVWNAALPYNLLVNSIASDPIEYSVSGTVRGSVSGSIGFVYTNDGTLATNLKLIPYVSSGTSGTVFLTNFSFSAVIT